MPVQRLRPTPSSVADADRDAVVERLRQAAVEGRLEPDELVERLHARCASTYGDLQRLVTDLPAKPMAWERRTADAMPAARTARAVVMRVVLTLAVVAVVLIVVGLMAACGSVGRSWDSGYAGVASLPPSTSREDREQAALRTHAPCERIAAS